MKKLLSALGLIVSVAGLSLQSVSASSYYAAGSTGVDVSYPKCSAAISKVVFGVVGVTGGRVFNYNSCAAAEAAHFTDLSLYANTGLNADPVNSTYYQQAQVGCSGDVYCAAYNYGYNAAKDALDYASSQNLSSQKWWLDVENGNTWNSDVYQNRKSLQGEYDALSQAGIGLVGVYSTTAQWQAITGSWQNGWVNWGATTWTTAKQAHTYCTGHQFTGGQSLLMQYKSKQSPVDQDVAC